MEDEQKHEHEDEEMTLEDVAYNNEALVNTLINLLIEKKVISEQDFVDALKKFEEDMSDEEKEN